MPDIIQFLRTALSEQDAAKVLRIANDVVQQYDEGLIKVLPCKVGDTVYHHWLNIIIPVKITEIAFREHGIYFYGYSDKELERFCILDNGRNDFKTCVVLTRPEAEKALERET